MRSRQNIVGVWRLASTRATDPDGKPARPAVRPARHGPGHADVGRPHDGGPGRRPRQPAGGPPRQYSSYCGNYTFDGSTLTTVVDANSDPVRFTAPQVRKVRFEGERMVLTPPASEIAGVKVTRELTWERITDRSL